MAETERREVVYAVTIQGKEAITQYRQFVEATNEARSALTENNKELRENKKNLDAVSVALKNGSINADEAEHLTADLILSRKELNKTNADLKASIAGLSSQERELKNDISGVTEAGLRFRDKMSDAFAGQLGQKLGALQAQLAAAQKAANDAAASLGKGSPEAVKTTAAVKALEGEIVKLKGITEGGFDSMRAKLAHANKELAATVQLFGRGSEEAKKAAQRVDELSDEVEILRGQAQAADLEGKFELAGIAASKVINVVGGATAALQLFGAEKGTVEEVGRAILALQQAQAIAEGLKSLGSLGKTFTSLAASLGLVTTATEASATASVVDAGAKTAEGEAAVVATGANKAFIASLATNPIFLAVAAVAALAAAWIAFDDDIQQVHAHYEDLSATLERKLDARLDLSQFNKDIAILRAELNNALAGGPESEDSIRERNGIIKASLDEQIADTQSTLNTLTSLDRQRTADEDKLYFSLFERLGELTQEREKFEISSEIDIANFRNKQREEEEKGEKKATDEAIKEAKRRRDEIKKVEEELTTIEKAQRPDTEQNAIADVNAQFDALAAAAKDNADLLVRIEEDRVTALNNVLFDYMAQKFQSEAAITQNEKDEQGLRIQQIGEYAQAASEANLAAQDQLLQAQQEFTDAAINAGMAFTDVLSSMAGESAEANKLLLVLQKGIAIAQVLVDAQRAKATALGNFQSITPLLPPFGIPNPGYAVAGAIYAAQVATINANTAASIGSIAASAIQGLAQGGIVEDSWGSPVQRSNGDNVLVRHADGGAVTLRTGEAVLTEEDQAAVKKRTGFTVFEIARGAQISALLGQQSFAIGGIVPRPSPQAVQAADTIRTMRELDNTVVVDIVEFTKYQNRLKVREDINTA